MNDKTVSVLLGSAIGIIIAVGIVFVVNTCEHITVLRSLLLCLPIKK